MRYLCLFVFALILSGCEDDPANIKTQEVTHKYDLPDSMKDCTVHNLRSAAGNYNTVIHCPNSRIMSNAHMVGKNQQYNTVINRQQQPTDTKEECEATLPRNQSCVAVWVPAAVETK